MGAKKKDIAEKILEFSRIDPTTGCRVWTGSVNRRGYGRVNVNNKNRYAHRVSWQIHMGEIPKGFFVCHKCDNPPCINPEHLFLGNPKINYDDMVSKGRRPPPETFSIDRKLNSVKANAIRDEYSLGFITQAEIARRYSISSATVNRIINRKLRKKGFGE